MSKCIAYMYLGYDFVSYNTTTRTSKHNAKSQKQSNHYVRISAQKAHTPQRVFYGCGGTSVKNFKKLIT